MVHARATKGGSHTIVGFVGLPVDSRAWYGIGVGGTELIGLGQTHCILKWETIWFM